jgi:hypothetical protein
MRKRVGVVFIAVATVLSATAAEAQERRFGLTLGAPSAVGIVWRVSDRVAIRPDFTFAVSSGESELAAASLILGEPPSPSSTDGSSVAIGGSALFYLARWDALRTYLSPRVSFAQSTITSSSSASTGRTEGSGRGAAGLFGAEYVLGQRFGVFGEVGLSYSRTTTRHEQKIQGVSQLPGSLLSSTGKSTGVGMLNSVGVIFFF